MSKYGVGIRNVGSYQVAGQPFITGSQLTEATGTQKNTITVNTEKEIEFPYVTKSIQIWNHSSNGAAVLRVHFDSKAVNNVYSNNHYFSLAQGETLSLSAKCKKIYLSAVTQDVQWKLYASLTNIATGSMYTLTGSGINN
tara:strand:+ start:215 stop:634 length:420 start_codon:yes stop_codon:yes gene_type:complete